MISIDQPVETASHKERVGKQPSGVGARQLPGVAIEVRDLVIRRDHEWIVDTLEDQWPLRRLGGRRHRDEQHEQRRAQGFRHRPSPFDRLTLIGDVSPLRTSTCPV